VDAAVDGTTAKELSVDDVPAQKIEETDPVHDSAEPTQDEAELTQDKIVLIQDKTEINQVEASLAREETQPT